jgi:hypothetical protein
MKNVYVVKDHVYETMEVYSIYSAACKEATEWAEYIKNNRALGEINQEVVEDETRWYEGNNFINPIVTVYTKKLLTN